ncbi:MAG: serine/threonine protein phosphatase [Roseburia sp.]|jgi:serine/threonine protein phosphatase 1|nr:serine/threonine protein phosphatase [Roseburia sp.]
MATYVVSDIHGCYDAYQQLLSDICFSEDDTLYVLGDMIDRGPHPIRVVLDLMRRPNVVCLAGNHESMAMECLPFLLRQITDETISALQAGMVEQLLTWQLNGGTSTMDEFHALDPVKRQAVVNFLSELSLYEPVSIGNRDYILVHAGLGNFRPRKKLWDYDLHDLVWARTDYETPYFPDRYVITGHTPTMTIPSNPRPGYIYQNANHIAIDCGAGFDGRLGCLCLETMEEFYVECQ